MDLDFITAFSPTKISRDKAHSWNLSQRERIKRSNKSLDRLDVNTPFLDRFLREEGERSSIASELPSFNGLNVQNASLHSLHMLTKLHRKNIYDILNDDLPNRANQSEHKSGFSGSSFGSSCHHKKRIFQIPSEPYRILDTPGLDDNYYTNALGWSVRNLIAVTLNNTVYLFNCETSEFQEVYEGYETEMVTSIAFSPDGDHLAIGNDLGQLAFWDVRTQKNVSTMNKHDDRIGCLDWGLTGLLSGSKDTTIQVSDMRHKKLQVSMFANHTQEVVGLKWSPCGRSFASGGNDNFALVWNIEKQEPSIRIMHKGGVRAVGWSEKLRGVMATGGGYSDKKIRTYNTIQNMLIEERETDGQVCALVFSKITNDLISSHGIPTNDISVWRTNGLKRVVQLKGHESRPLHISLSPDSSILVSVSSDETMRFWKLYEQGIQSKPFLEVNKKEAKEVNSDEDIYDCEERKDGDDCCISDKCNPDELDQIQSEDNLYADVSSIEMDEFN